MNKYTLTFTDKHLEELYVINKRQKIQQPIYWYVVVAGTLVLMTNVIISLVNENYEGFYYKLSVMLYLFFSGMIVFKKKKLTNTSLIIINLIIVLLEQELRSDYNVYDGFLQGSNQMIVHVILLIVTEFKLAILTNLILGGLRLLLTGLNSDGIELTQYIYTILIMICLSMILYQAEKHQREYYLLSVKDNSWENFLSKILQKPFFTFTFDKENCKFRKQIYRIQGMFEDLDQFLDNCKMKHINLKTYILQLLQENTTEQREQLKVTYEGKYYNITFISCYLDQLTLIITIDSEDSYLKSIIQNYEKKYQIVQQAFAAQVKVTGQIIGEYLRHKNRSVLIDLKITLFQSYLLQDIKKSEIELVNLKQMLGKLFKNFKLLNYNIELFCPQEVVEQKILKKYWFLFILELFRKVYQNKNQKIKFSIFQYGNAIRLTINGLQLLPTSELYYRCHNMLIKEEIRTNQSKINEIFQFRHCISIPQYSLIVLCTAILINQKINLLIFGNYYISFIKKNWFCFIFTKYQLMNRFTLQFVDPQLELKYKTVLIQQIYKKVFYAFNICTQFFLLLKIIDGAINQNQSQFEVKIAYFSFLLILLIITCKWKSALQFGLFLSNMLLMAFQIMQREDETQHTFIFGQNQMGIHTIILLMTDFQEAAIGNIIIYIFRQSVGEIKSPNGLGYQDHLFSFAVQSFLMICLYYKNLYQRRFFLLALKDKEVDKILLELIQKPALIFTYNEEKIQFEQKKIVQFQSLQKIENPLTYFLRESNYEGNNLESYILSRIKSRQCSPVYFIQEMLIIYKNQPKLITYAESYLTFFIIIQSDDPKLAEIQSNNSIKIEKIMKQFINLISQSSKLLHKAMKQRNLKLLIDLQISYLQIIEQNYYKNSSKAMVIKKVNLLKTVKKIIQLFNIKCQLICQSENPIELKLIKRKLIIFLMVLFRYSSFQQTYSCIRIEQQEAGPIITIRALLNLPQNKQFQNLFSNLIQNYCYQNKSHTFLFRNEPFHSYQEQN